MRKYIFLVVILVVLAGGGFLTALNNAGGFENLIPYLQQTSSPEASPVHATSWQTEQLVFLIGFLLFNLVGIGATIAFIMWALDRQVRITRVNSGEQVTVEDGEKAEA